MSRKSAWRLPRILLPVFILSTLPLSAFASLAGMETILVRGFGNGPDNLDALGITVDNGFVYDVSLHIDYVSPVYGESGGGRDLYEYLRGAPDQAAEWPVKCQQECMVISKSMGDLVTRVFLENQKAWAAEDGIAPFNVIATIDFVGTSGGSEVANWWLLAGPDGREFFQNTLSSLGISPPDLPLGDSLDDMRPGIARAMATRFDEHRVPRFRISVRPDVIGETPLGYINVRNHDLLVPAHSSCGVNDSIRLLNSCVDHVGYSGVTHNLGIKLHHDGPGTFNRGLWPYYYPIVMGSGFWNHQSSTDNTLAGPMIYVEKKLDAQGVGFDFDGFAEKTVINGIPYKELYNCRLTWWGPSCDSRWVTPILYRRQQLKNADSIVDLIGKTFFRP